jgi:hypothetical protein
MASERQQLWKVSKETNAEKPRITVTLELAMADIETGEIFETAPWRAIYELRADEGRASIAGVQLEPADSTRPSSLPAQLARDLLKPGLALAAGRYGLRDMIEDPNVSIAEQRARAKLLADWHGLDAAQLGTERRGKRQPDYFYAAIASRYLDEVASGSRRPVADTAQALPGGYEATFVRDALDRARKRELLERPKGGARHAGGQLTARGVDVLAAGPPSDGGRAAAGLVAPSPPRDAQRLRARADRD